MPAEGTLTIMNCRIIFRNFAGQEGKYNRAGDRHFSILLDEDLAEELKREGWNVHYLKAREEGDVPQAIIQVAVSYNKRPPRVVMVTSRGKTPLSEAEVEILDWVDIKSIDVILNPYSWNVNGRGGIKAYLRSLYVEIEEDALELKWADVPEIGSSQVLNVIDGDFRETPLAIDMLPARGGRIEE